MKGKKIKSLLLIAIFILSTLAIVNAHPDAVVTPATGGGAISADDAGVTWTTLNSMVITEGAFGEIGVGVYTLTIPGGFEFDTTSGPDVVASVGDLVVATPAAITGTTIQFSVTTASTAMSVLTIGGVTPIKVRPTAGTPLLSLDITMSAGNIPGVIIGTTNFGTLTMVPGALDDFTITGGLPNCIAHTDWDVNNVIVTAFDVFGHLKTNYLGTVVWSSSDPVADLPAAYTFTSGDAGSHTFPGTDFTMKMVGTSQDITVADGSISASITPITVIARGITVTLDEAFYKTGDSVVVTVIDDDENDRPSVIETLEVEATSPYPDLIMVTLTETGVATGEFVGSFNLVGVAPGANDLLVEDEYTITVTYTFSDTAIIDDTSPTVTNLLPANEELISDNHPPISADVDDVGSDVASAVMKLDDALVDSIIGPGTMSYEVPEFPEELRLSEGIHTIEVTAIDNVGNSATETWTFTVDLVKPTVSVTVDPDPAMAGPVTFTLTFNEDMNTGTSPVIQFGTVDPYTTHTIIETGWTTDSLREWKGTFTVTSLTGDGLNTISVSLATDEAGNVMEIDISNTFVIDTVAPTLPEGLVATVTDVSVTIDWTASTDLDGTGVEKYLIDRNDVTDPIAEVTHPSTTYTDYSLIVEDSYMYTVTAIDFAGNEAESTGVLAEFIPGDVIAREIELYEDWNLISLPMIPKDSDIEVVLENVMAGVEIVWSWDEGNWYRYLPGQPLFSTLTDMEDGKGYWLKMEGEDSLIAYGTELPEPPALPPVYHVYVDWNLIGFKSIDTMSITNYFTTIPQDTLDTAVCYRFDAPTQAYELVYLGGELTPAIPFEPGQGYFLYLVEEANIAPP